jgi:hypothetical protein
MSTTVKTAVAGMPETAESTAGTQSAPTAEITLATAESTLNSNSRGIGKGGNIRAEILAALGIPATQHCK